MNGPCAVDVFLDGVEEAVAYPAVGLSYLTAPSWRAEEVGQLRERVTADRGFLVLMGGALELKRAVGVWGAPGPEVGLMQKVKMVFDPERILSPGRLYGL